MIKIFSSFAVAGLMAGMLAIPAQAQGTMDRVERSMERGLKRATAGQAAPLTGSMTQAQARKACQQEMAGTRESKAALRKKMTTCVNGKMQGN
ncbi:hypothetical protein [Bosea sp. Root381]|uniref:hypothetical protein n=1 Tax=Bosea sp. Root381 TaxID=1736524 RepID=UPI000B06F2F5|nr:hypothetical protein [Bosea sp. Root381]